MCEALQAIEGRSQPLSSAVGAWANVKNRLLPGPGPGAAVRSPACSGVCVANERTAEGVGSDTTSPGILMELTPGSLVYRFQTLSFLENGDIFPSHLACFPLPLIPQTGLALPGLGGAIQSLCALGFNGTPHMWIFPEVSLFFKWDISDYSYISTREMWGTQDHNHQILLCRQKDFSVLEEPKGARGDARVGSGGKCPS